MGPRPTDAARRSALAAYPRGPRCVDTLHDVLHDKVHVTNNDTDDFNPDYSPDGEKIAYMGPDGEIYTIGARGGGKSRVTNNVFAYGLSWGTRP